MQRWNARSPARRSTCSRPTRRCWSSARCSARTDTSPASGRTSLMNPNTPPLEGTPHPPSPSPARGRGGAGGEGAPLKLTLVHLYPDLMNVYGDRGNIITFRRRCAWRGIELDVQPVSLGDRLTPGSTDLIFFGGGQDREQAVISPDFVSEKGQAVREAVEDGAVVLAVCGGYQLLGHTYTTVDGQELPGAGVFDVRSVPGTRRHIGNLVAEANLDGTPRTLVGFENHSGQTYLGPGVTPLA